MAASDRVKDLVESGNEAHGARSLYDENKRLLITFGLKFGKIVCQTAISYKCNLTQQSDSSTQASTISPVQAENKQDTESADSDDAAGETDDEYPPRYVNDPKADAGDESEDDAQAASEEEI